MNKPIDDNGKRIVEMDEVIDALWNRFGREPTEDEVYLFIFGTDKERLHIWNRMI